MFCVGARWWLNFGWRGVRLLPDDQPFIVPRFKNDLLSVSKQDVPTYVELLENTQKWLCQLIFLNVFILCQPSLVFFCTTSQLCEKGPCQIKINYMLCFNRCNFSKSLSWKCKMRSETRKSTPVCNDWTHARVRGILCDETGFDVFFRWGITNAFHILN